MLKGPLLFKRISPLVVFVPLKLVTRFVLSSVVPTAEFVVRRPVAISPEPDSLIVFPAVSVTGPVVVTFPAFKFTLLPAFKTTVPDPLTTSALTSRSLAGPVETRVMFPLAVVVTPVALPTQPSPAIVVITSDPDVIGVSVNFTSPVAYAAKFRTSLVPADRSIDVAA